MMNSQRRRFAKEDYTKLASSDEPAWRAACRGSEP